MVGVVVEGLCKIRFEYGGMIYCELSTQLNCLLDHLQSLLSATQIGQMACEVVERLCEIG
jgi:hypothetical protein